jgi:hypothetical protein
MVIVFFLGDRRRAPHAPARAHVALQRDQHGRPACPGRGLDASPAARTASPPRRRATPRHRSLCATTQVRRGRRAPARTAWPCSTASGHEGSDTNCWCSPRLHLFFPLTHSSRQRWKKKDTQIRFSGPARERRRGRTNALVFSLLTVATCLATQSRTPHINEQWSTYTWTEHTGARTPAAHDAPDPPALPRTTRPAPTDCVWSAPIDTLANNLATRRTRP